MGDRDDRAAKWLSPTVIEASAAASQTTPEAFLGDQSESGSSRANRLRLPPLPYGWTAVTFTLFGRLARSDGVFVVEGPAMFDFGGERGLRGSRLVDMAEVVVELLGP